MKTIYKFKISCEKKYVRVKKSLHTTKKIFALDEIWHVQKFAFVFLCTVQICDFCIWKIICAADLRILCTTVFCTFADLRIYTFAHLHKLVNLCSAHVVGLLRVCTWKYFCETCAKHVKFVFFHAFFTRNLQFFVKIDKFSKISQKRQNVRFCPVGFWRVPENVRKKLTCSWVVHEWFLGQRVWQHRVAKVARICIN